MNYPTAALDAKGITIPLLATLAVQSVVSLVAVTMPVLAPTAAIDIGVSAATVGLYVSMMYVGGMFSSLIAGNFILRYGALRVSQVCLVLTGIGLMISALASIPAMVISAFIIGFGYGPVTPASSHILARNTPARMRSFVFSLKQTGVPLGGVMAGAIVPTLVIAAGWKTTTVLVGVAAILLGLSLNPLQSRLDNDKQPARLISFKGVFSPLKIVFVHRSLRELAVISFLYAGMQLCLFTYLVVYLIDDIGMAFIAAGFTLSAAQIAGTVGRIIWGGVADRFIKPRLLLGLLGIGMSIGAVATAAITASWTTVAIVAAVGLFGMTSIGWNGVYLAEAARVAPDGQVGAATGGTLFFTFLGVVIGPPIFAAIVSASGSYALGYVFFAALTFVGGLKTIFSRSADDSSEDD